MSVTLSLESLSCLISQLFTNNTSCVGEDSVYIQKSPSCSVWNIFPTHRQKETCFLQQEFIKVSEQQCSSSSRTGTASTHFSRSKYTGSAGNVGFLWPHLYTVQSTSQAVFFPTVFWDYEFAAQQKICFLFNPCATALIHSWLFNQREINQIVPHGPRLFGKPQKDQICVTKLKIRLRVPLNPPCDDKSVEEMWSWCTILFGKSSIHIPTLKLFWCSGPVLINH